MTQTEIDLNPVDFVTIGTIGPPGKRVFHLQAGHEGRIISFIIEKEQAWALGEAIQEFLDDLEQRLDMTISVEMSSLDMDLREPIEPMFRVSQMGLAYEESTQSIILVAREMTLDESEADVVRMWCNHEQLYALSIQAMETVEAGRPDPRQNGRITYYWT